MSNAAARDRSSVEAEYVRRLDARRRERAVLDRRHGLYGALRLLIAGSLLTLFVTTGLRHPALAAAVIAAFAMAAVLHARLLGRRSKAAAAIEFYERGLRGIRDQWIGAGRPGEGYRPHDHLFADDLDLFGRGSLFEMLSTTRTRAGEEVLSRWLLSPASGEDARARQAAVRELAELTDLRERIAVTGDDIRTAVDAPVLRRWAAAPIALSGGPIRLALFLLGATTSGAVLTWFVTGRLGMVAAAAVLVQSAVAAWLKPRVTRVIESVEEPAHDLEVLADLLRILEQASFTSPSLRGLTGRLTRTKPASQEIAALARRVALLSSRRNVMFAIPAAFMMWSTQWAAAIEAWRSHAGRDIPLWLDVVGEFEALVAVAECAAEHPDHVYPDVVEGAPRFEARDLRHAALGASAVGNDIALAREGLALLVVSGSNMSGKSTWLRTIGTTVVLAGLGAPVRAAACRLSMVAIGAAIRVPDSLLDGKSRFFAEITRLKAILDLARNRQGAVLFLLDEILGGTNSHDRQVGAEALVRGLVSTGAIGLVTTHDLAIGGIADALGERAANVHFADQFEGGVLHFDYRMRPGVVQTRNALALMRSIGIEV